MDKFTSGPWGAKFYRNGPVWGWDIKAGGKVIARIVGGAIWEDEPNPQDEADARRIVQCVNSFDDLLAALEVVVDVFNLSLYGTDTGGGKCYSKIQAAIAKATGGQNDE